MCWFLFFFLRDVHTFAHLNVLSGCCYRYPGKAQWGGEGSNWEKSEKKKQMRMRCSRKSTESGSRESLERVKQCRRGMGDNNPAGSEFIKSERRCEKWKEGMMTGEEQENELSTCQCIKALSCHILTRSHTHSSPQCLNLMSQVPLNGSCMHQHYHTAIISLCYRQFIALYSSASIFIRRCHDLHLHTVMLPTPDWLTFSIAKSKTFTYTTAYGIWWVFLSIAPYSNMNGYTWVGG